MDGWPAAAVTVQRRQGRGQGSCTDDKWSHLLPLLLLTAVNTLTAHTHSSECFTLTAAPVARQALGSASSGNVDCPQSCAQLSMSRQGNQSFTLMPSACRMASTMLLMWLWVVPMSTESWP